MRVAPPFCMYSFHPAPALFVPKEHFNISDYSGLIHSSFFKASLSSRMPMSCSAAMVARSSYSGFSLRTP